MRNILNNIQIKVRLKSTWIKPEGLNTGIKIFNCVTKQKEPLIINESRIMKWYTCGPTVYDSPHLGHASCYVKLDIIKKILKRHFKYNVITVMNVTDIDDKIIKKCRELNVNFSEISKKFEKEFFKTMTELNVAEPDVVVRVTENVDLIIDFIEKLERLGFAYYKNDDNSVYFDVKKYDSYGKLQEIVEETGGDDGGKKLDFVLWKASKEGEPSWTSPWGKGRPGWHIECSALASHILGDNIDIHAGGIDLKFPHHENEEAQSCCYHNKKQWINYWLHVGHLHKKTDKQKMSKSLNNTISIREMLRKTTPDAFRMACLMSNYKHKMLYSEDLLKTAENNLKIYKNFIESCEIFLKTKSEEFNKNPEILLKSFELATREVHDALCDNFDTPKVLKCVQNLIRVTNLFILNSTQTSGSLNCSNGSPNSINDSISIHDAINNSNAIPDTFPSSLTDNNFSAIPYVIAIKNFVENIFYVFDVNIYDKKTNVDVSNDDFVNLINFVVSFRNNLRSKALVDKNIVLLKLCDDLRDELKKFRINVRDI